MDKKKKLMILGASYSQIPLIQAAKRMGITALVASIPGNYQGFESADEIAYVDITDPEAVFQGRDLERRRLPAINIWKRKPICSMGSIQPGFSG